LYGESALQTPASAKPVSGAAPVRDIAAPAADGNDSTHKRSIASWVLLLLVRMYVIFLSPFLGGACKFYPSCSNYAREAIERHGARRGIVLALKRLLRCHPFTPGGFDFVPDELPERPGVVHTCFSPSGEGKSR